MSMVIEAPLLIETAGPIESEIGNFVATQAVNVVNSNFKVVDWYLSKAMENPALAQLTKFISDFSIQVVNPGKINGEEVVGAAIAGGAAGFAAGASVSLVDIMWDTTRSESQQKAADRAKYVVGVPTVIGAVIGVISDIFKQSQ